MLEGWSDCLRAELKPFGIDVIIIEPGLISTEFGDVTLGSMQARSEDTAYADIIKRMTAALENLGVDGLGVPPSVIANAIVKALRAKRPKTRYAAGQYAKPLLFLRWLLSDRMFDRLISRMSP